MSGICGIYSPNHPTLACREILHKMLDAIGHRGTAARRLYVDDNAGIAIGHVFEPTFQAPNKKPAPSWLEDGDYVATLDGAIFNHQDFLAADWPQPDKDHSAGAAIEHLRRSPAEFPEKLDGHFALTVWDHKQRHLWLVRDALGGKPLYYAHFAGKGLTVFASELKGILPHPAVTRRLNRDALTAYLTFGYIPAPLSILEGIHKVFPGEALRGDAAGQMRRRQYWNTPRFAPHAGTLEDFAEQLREQILQTISKHLEGVQRVGLFLSGGVDSSVLLGALKLLGVPERETFTLGFQMDSGKSQLCEDLQWGEWVAQLHATRHHPILITKGHNPNFLLPRILRQFDEPMITPNCYSKYFLSEAAREIGLNSCLSGSNLGFLIHRLSKGKIRKLRAEAGVNLPDNELFLHFNMKLFSFDEQSELLAEPVTNPRDVALHLTDRYGQGVEADEFTDLLDGMLLRLQGTEKSITVQDRTSVLNGVEIRHPFHDAKLLQFVNLIPARFKGFESDQEGKAVLKEAFKDILPEEVANRKKIGYPSYYWTQGEVEELKQRLLSPAGLARTGLFRPDTVQRILEADKTSTKKSAGKPTWALLIFQAWYELYLNRNDELFAKG